MRGERRRAAPASIAAWSGRGSGADDSRIAPSLRPLVGADRGRGRIEGAVVAVVSIGPNRPRPRLLRAAAADRMRAPEAAPATSATASHSLRASGEVGSSRKPRPPTDCQCSPRASRRRDNRSGKARAMAFAQCHAFRSSRGRQRFAHRSAIRRAACARGRGRCASAGAGPPGRDRCRPARARSAAPRRRRPPWRNPARPASISMWARRGSSGDGGDGAAMRVIMAVTLDRTQPRQPFAGLGQCRRRRRIEEGQPCRDRLSPHSKQVSSRLDRSASRISGGSWAGSEVVAASSHNRIATPGAWRAARPARWVTAARLARSVTSRVRPAPRS